MNSFSVPWLMILPLLLALCSLIFNNCSFFRVLGGQSRAFFSFLLLLLLLLSVAFFSVAGGSGFMSGFFRALLYFTLYVFINSAFFLLCSG